MLSQSGINKSFGFGADGYVRGEGAAAIVIGRMETFRKYADSKMLKPGKIYASLLSSAVNQDGRSASFTAPNGSAQRDVLIQALNEAEVQPKEVCFIEAHGTGTALGDPIEISALCDVFIHSNTNN